MTPQQLTEEYIFAHDLREASAKIADFGAP